MKVKTDENLPTEAAAILRESGLDAQTVWDGNLSGSDGHILTARARTEGRILLTFDLAARQTDNGAGLTKGVIGLVNRGQRRKPEDWGPLRTWHGAPRERSTISRPNRP